MKPRFVMVSLMLILWAAWGIRLAYVNELRETFPDFLQNQPFCGIDANHYHSAGQRNAVGLWPSDQPHVHMVLYPYFVGTIYRLGHPNLYLVVISQILLEVLTCAALYRLTRLTFGSSAGLLAGLLLAGYRPLIFHTPCYTQANLTMPLLTLTLLFLVKAQALFETRRQVTLSDQRERRVPPYPTLPASWGYLFLAAVMLSLAFLSRPNVLVLLPLFGLWWLLNGLPLKRLIGQTVLVVGVMFLVTLPVSLHNYRTANQFSPLPLSGLENIFTGNNPISEGLDQTDYVQYRFFDSPNADYLERVRQAAAENEVAYLDEALKFILGRPGDWLNLMGRKIYLLLAETDDNLISPYFVHDMASSRLLSLIPIEWRSIFIGALFGLVFVSHTRRNLLLFGMALTLIGVTIIFYAQLRFRLLLVPLMIPYAAAFLATVPSLRRWQAGLVVTGLTLLYPFLPVIGWLLGAVVGGLLWMTWHRRDWSRLGWQLVAVGSGGVVLLWLSYLVAFASPTGQRQAIITGPPIAGPMMMGQTFTMPCDGFNRLTLTMGDYGFEATQPLEFHLRAGLDRSSDIFSTTIETTALDDRSPLTINLPPQTNSAGQDYFFFLAAPNVSVDRAMALRGTYEQPYDRYPEGSIYAGQPGAWQRLAADATFQASCQLSPMALISQTFRQLAGGPGKN